ncbi:MAG: PD40 domain-containing protein [Caldilineaceae bacterium]|nr:PD40 domain-containing protein [Caldilineaceae bacterium]
MDRLEGPQLEKIHKAIISGYDEASLARMVAFELSENLGTISYGKSFSETVFNLLMWAEQYDRTDELVRAAVEHNPHNSELRKIQQDIKDWREEADKTEDRKVITDVDKKTEAHANRRFKPIFAIPTPYWWKLGLAFLIASLLALGIYSLKKSSPAQLTRNSGYNYQPSLSLSEDQIVFISTRDGNPEIYLMGTDGKNQRRITHTPNIKEDSPSFTPDGMWIIYSGNDGAQEDIYIIRSDGSNTLNLTQTPHSNEGRPSVFHDRFIVEKLLFDSDQSGNWEIYMGDFIQQELKNVTQITSRTDFYSRLPSFIETQNRILFRSEPIVDGREKSEIYTIDITGENPQSLSQGQHDWSPSAMQKADWITFVSDRNGNPEIYAMHLSTGRETRRLTFNETEDDMPTLSADGKWLFYTSTSRSGQLDIFRSIVQPGLK